MNSALTAFTRPRKASGVRECDQIRPQHDAHAIERAGGASKSERQPFVARDREPDGGHAETRHHGQQSHSRAPDGRTVRQPERHAARAEAGAARSQPRPCGPIAECPRRRSAAARWRRQRVQQADPGSSRPAPAFRENEAQPFADRANPPPLRRGPGAPGGLQRRHNTAWSELRGLACVR